MKQNLGVGMLAASLLILVGWSLYKLWQADMYDECVAMLAVCLFVGGITIGLFSDD